jgi:hypothetical protein
VEGRIFDIIFIDFLEQGSDMGSEMYSLIIQHLSVTYSRIFICVVLEENTSCMKNQACQHSVLNSDGFACDSLLNHRFM